MVYLHLYAVLDADGQQSDGEDIADKRQRIGCIGLSQLIGGEFLILILSPSYDLCLQLADIEDLCALDAFLQ